MDSGSGAILRAPVCGLGFTASSSGGTLSLNFNLGIDTPALFNILVRSKDGTAEPFSREIPLVEPVKSFTLEMGLHFRTSDFSQ